MTQIRVLSVQQLLDKIRDDNPEGWVLPLAQRAFVWRDTQITRLVDSLLKGFPVGSLLLSEAMGPHFALKSKGKRVAQKSGFSRFGVLRIVGIRKTKDQNYGISTTAGKRQVKACEYSPYRIGLSSIFGNIYI